MLTVAYITSRGLHPLTKLGLGQYELLAQALAAQTDDAGRPFTDYEVVIVDKDNPLPRPEVALACRDAVGGVTCLRPRATPWTRMGAFAPNAARNTALCHARGDVVVGLDDCFEPGPRYLWRTAQLAAADVYAVATLRSADDGVAYGEQPPGPVAPAALVGGLCAFPLAAAVALNGWDERFDGCSGGDVDFTWRLRLAGVRLARHPDVAATGHDHGGRAAAHPRCWRVVCALGDARRAAGALRACEPWTAAERAAFATCGQGEDCGYTGFPCDREGAQEPSLTHEIMVGYEAQRWFDLAAARAAAAEER